MAVYKEITSIVSKHYVIELLNTLWELEVITFSEANRIKHMLWAKDTSLPFYDAWVKRS